MDATKEQKKRAHGMVRIATRRGELVREEYCEICGLSEDANGGSLHGHHLNGYGPGHELDVQWLCTSCHARIHPGSGKLTSPEHMRMMRASRKITSAALSRKMNCRRWHGPDCWDDDAGCQRLARLDRDTSPDHEEARR